MSETRIVCKALSIKRLGLLAVVIASAVSGVLARDIFDVAVEAQTKALPAGVAGRYQVMRGVEPLGAILVDTSTGRCWTMKLDPERKAYWWSAVEMN
jgi:hypothetical protein